MLASPTANNSMEVGRHINLIEIHNALPEWDTFYGTDFFVGTADLTIEEDV